MMHSPIAFDLVHAIVGNGHRAQRHAPMTATGQAKYFTVHEPLIDDQVAAHLLGTATYAVPLIGTDKLASAGVIEQDAGGLEMARRILAAAEARGVTMFAIVCKGSDGHDGCHPWALYDGRYDPKAIRAQLQQIAEDAGASTGEIYPSNQNIRLPFAVHLRSKTRGDLLLQSSELYHLDTELEAAERAVMALPLNSAPPPVVSQPKASVTVVQITSSRTARARTNDEIAEKIRDVTERTIAEFKRLHTLESLLAEDGAKETRDGYTCPHCQHSHETTLYISNQGRLFSYSPRCLLHTTKGWDELGYYIKTRYNDNFRAAIDALSREYGFWFDALRARAALKADRQDNAPLAEPEHRYTDEQRAAYNAARREKRHQETKDALDAIYVAASNLEFTSALPAGASAEAHADRARLLFVYLLGLAHERGVLQVAPTNEQIAADLDMCRRNVIHAFRELEAAGLGKRQGGRNVEGNEAATWTFYRSPNLGCKPHQEAICTLDYRESDLVLNLRSCERAAFSPACENV